MNGSDPVSRLEGLEMFPLDCHVKINLLEARMFKLIYTFEILAMFSLHLACMEILLYQPVCFRAWHTIPTPKFDWTY